MHVFPLFQHVSFQNVLIILTRIGSTHHKSPKLNVSNYGFIPFCHHGWWNLYLFYRPRILSPRMVMPNWRIKESTELVPWRLGLTRWQVALQLSLLPFHVLKVEVNETRPYLHRNVPEKPGDHQVIKLFAQYLQVDLLLKFEVDKNLLERERVNK